MYNFTSEQEEFLASSGKVVLHACPGSGKTTVVAQKVLHYLENWNRPHQGIAVLSFTNVASDEIARQAREVLPPGYSIETPHFVGTLDSFIDNYIFLRFGYLLLQSRKRPIIATYDIAESYPYWRRDCHRQRCVSDIEQFRWNNDMVLTKNGNLITCTGFGKYDPPCVQFKNKLFEKGLFFQGEIAGLTCTLLKKYPEVAKIVAARFPIIILDEAQDTSIEQMEILDLLCNAGLESVFIVGDPDQAIYEWRTANPESFIKKMADPNWTRLSLSKNFRSSQRICDATYVFSDILRNKQANEAVGESSSHSQKPVVLLYQAGVSIAEIIAKFSELCKANTIAMSSSHVAIVTRGKVHSDIDIDGLWKTAETEFLAKASYEWLCGNRKKAYGYCEKAVFQLTVKKFEDIELSIEEDVANVIQYDLWKQMIIELLVNLPSANNGCGGWITDTKVILSRVLSKYNMQLLAGLMLDDAIKIKSRDTKRPNFKQIPVKDFFEKKIQREYTQATVHGVKGETYDALMLLIDKTKGATLTPSFLANGETNKELMRIAYVAMTRPRRLLVVALPQSSADLSVRFPKDKWDYLEI